MKNFIFTLFLILSTGLSSSAQVKGERVFNKYETFSVQMFKGLTLDEEAYEKGFLKLYCSMFLCADANFYLSEEKKNGVSLMSFADNTIEFMRETMELDFVRSERTHEAYYVTYLINDEYKGFLMFTQTSEYSYFAWMTVSAEDNCWPQAKNMFDKLTKSMKFHYK